MPDGDYGYKLLKKMGWESGRGLGKDVIGITTPIQIAHQRDTAGIGSTHGVFDAWWEDMYISASKKITPQLSPVKRPAKKSKK